jgi:hypothetical protein
MRALKITDPEKIREPAKQKFIVSRHTVCGAFKITDPKVQVFILPKRSH